MEKPAGFLVMATSAVDTYRNLWNGSGITYFTFISIQNSQKLKYKIQSQKILKNKVEVWYNSNTWESNQNLIQKEIKKKLNSDNACYHSVQNLLSSRLLSKNLRIRIYKTLISTLIPYECETWSLTLREEDILRVFENRVLRRMFGLKRDEVTGGWRKLHNEERHNLFSVPNLIRKTK
jgi:hypothetical protein